MERRQIEYFLAVVDHRGFTAAAAALFVAQPSVSYAVRTLEREIGAPLIDRLPSGVRLTAAGEAFVEPARQVLRALETARSHVADVIGAVQGTLDLVALPAMVLDPLGPALATFRDNHPDVRIRVAHAVDASDVMTAVRQGKADLGFADVHPGTDDAQLVGVPLAEQSVVLALPPGSDVAPGGPTTDQLARIPFIATHTGGAVMTALADRCAARGHTLRVVVEIENREAALHLVVAGVGAAVLPSPLARMAAERGAVVVPLEPPVSRQLFLVRRRQTTISPAAARLESLLLSAAEENRQRSASP